MEKNKPQFPSNADFNLFSTHIVAAVLRCVSINNYIAQNLKPQHFIHCKLSFSFASYDGAQNEWFLKLRIDCRRI
jgi:hypothetical protein